MIGHRAPDLDPEERGVDRLLSAIPPVPPPLGFRDTVMRRIEGPHTFGERALAGALVVPSLLFLAWEIAVEGVDIALALGNALALAAGTSDQAFFFVDGILVFAFALLGWGALLGAHALIAGEAGRR